MTACTCLQVFIIGALLIVLLPLATSPKRDTSDAAKDPAWQLSDSTALTIWVAAGVTTAAGRVLADVHWLSDTLAGGALAVGGVSALAWAVGRLGGSSTS